MKDLVLIGRPGAGKTCMAKIMSGGVAPTTYEETNKAKDYKAKNGSFIFNFGKTIITDTGGRKLDSSTWNNYCLKGDRLIFYVFDGKEFLKELDCHWEGGEIGSSIRNELLPIYRSYERMSEDSKKKSGYNCKVPISDDGLGKNVYFIATHKDKCLIGDMKDKIISKMNSIQDECPGRYFFHKRMLSTLYCINATDVDEVKQLFDKIVG